jgi:hypothetical protein
MIALPDFGSNNGSTDLQFAAATAVNGDATTASYVAVGWGYNGLHDLGGAEANDDGVDSTDLNREALMWTANGVQNIETLAASLGLNLTGWDLQEATGISDNGRIIVGWGFNPQGNSEGWVLSLPSSAIAGDFDLNGVVNGLDLAQWKGDFGGPGSDADGDNDSDGNDFLIWQRNFGAGPGVNAVPESSTAALMMIAGAWAGFMGFLKPNPRGSARYLTRRQLTFTLAYLSIIIAITKVLVERFLPAVQLERKPVRPSQCEDNLKRSVTVGSRFYF